MEKSGSKLENENNIQEIRGNLFSPPSACAKIDLGYGAASIGMMYSSCVRKHQPKIEGHYFSMVWPQWEYINKSYSTIAHLMDPAEVSHILLDL